MVLQIFSFLVALLHPYYVSVTEIKHHAKTQHRDYRHDTNHLHIRGQKENLSKS